MSTPKLSKEALINQARHYASLAPLNSANMASAELQYDLIKASMLNERPWPFTVVISSDIHSTTQGEDLGYSKKYRLPADAVGVVALNPRLRYTPNSNSNYDLIRIGLVPNDDQPVSNLSDGQDFFVKNGILHANVDVDEILYQRDPKEKDLTVDFTLALAWNMAKYFAITVSNDGSLAAYCANEAETHHAKAVAWINAFHSINT